MKKILSLVLCFITAISFSSCITIPTPLDIRFEVEEITSIEVYYFEKFVYESHKTGDFVYQEWKEDGSSEEIPYTGEPIAYVEEADYEQFVLDLEAAPFKQDIILIPAAWDPSWDYIGYVVKINCKEDYQLITNKGGGRLRYYKEEDWQEFLKKYIGEEHFQVTQENS